MFVFKKCSKFVYFMFSVTNNNEHNEAVAKKSINTHDDHNVCAKKLTR